MKIFTDMTRVKISDCFYNVIDLLCFAMKLGAIVCKLDRFLENWQIVQCNLQIGQIGRLDGTYIYNIICNMRTATHESIPSAASRGTSCTLAARTIFMLTYFINMLRHQWSFWQASSVFSSADAGETVVIFGSVDHCT